MTRAFESTITFYARTVFANPKLRVKDLQEWSTRPIADRAGEATAHIKELGVYVAVLTACDKRVKATGSTT
jgi:hypothetical protein